MRGHWSFALRVLLAVPLGLGCGPPSYEAGEIRNALLISIDTLRADHLGVYGAPPHVTPNLDRLASEGVHFELAIASNPMTLPSHATLLTGTTPLRHGVHDNDQSRLGLDPPALAEQLQEAGFRTAAFAGATILSVKTGVARGFDLFDEVAGSSGELEAGGYGTRTAGEVVARVLRFLEDPGAAPFFLFVHLYDPHYPYTPPEPYRTRFPDHPYAGEVAYADGALGLLFDALRAAGELDRTLVVVTADHGESFGEHGEYTHGYYAYQPTQHIPLVVRAPGLGGGRAISGAVGLHDVAPTILSLLGVEVPADMEGLDLSARLAGAPAAAEPRYVYCESFMPTKVGCNPIFALVSERWKLVSTTRPELYDLEADPREEHDLFESEPARAAALAERLRTHLEAALPGDLLEPDAETRSQLAALGYLTGPIDASWTIDPSRPDPKDRLEAWDGIRRVSAGIREGEFDAARALAQQVLRAHPDLLELRRLLGELAVAEESWSRALVEYELYLHLLEASPGGGDPVHRSTARNAMGVAQLELGKYEKALAHFEVARALAPGDPNAARSAAVALVALGRIDEAIAQLSHVLELAPDDQESRRARERLIAGDTTGFR